MSAPARPDLDEQLAALLADPDTRYLLLCRECRHAWEFQRDSKTVKLARKGEAVCSECSSEIDLVVDAKDGDPG